METETSKKTVISPYMTPISIVIAGVLIAGGIMLSRSMPAQDNGSSNASLDDRLVMLADKIGLDKKDFAACLATGKSVAVDADIASGKAAGAVGTPYFIVSFKDNRRPAFAIPGAAPKQMFADLIDGKSVEGFEPETLTNFEPVTDTDHVRGAADPDIFIIEYSDADCPYCHKAHPDVQALVAERGNISWAYRALPLDIHPEAYRKAEASECAAELGGNDAFWKYTDQLMVSAANAK
jgi:protein-disulfide isomerase